MVKEKTYCWKCEKNVEMDNKRELTRDNKSTMMKGNCKDCKTLITKFMKKSK